MKYNKTLILALSLALIFTLAQAGPQKGGRDEKKNNTAVEPHNHTHNHTSDENRTLSNCTNGTSNETHGHNETNSTKNHTKKETDKPKP